jgi:hypothetical protein
MSSLELYWKASVTVNSGINHWQSRFAVPRRFEPMLDVPVIHTKPEHFDFGLRPCVNPEIRTLGSSRKGIERQHYPGSADETQ